VVFIGVVPDDAAREFTRLARLDVVRASENRHPVAKIFCASSFSTNLSRINLRVRVASVI
jgi:translation initiation factor IF-3